MIQNADNSSCLDELTEEEKWLIMKYRLCGDKNGFLEKIKEKNSLKKEINVSIVKGASL